MITESYNSRLSVSATITLQVDVLRTTSGVIGKSEACSSIPFGRWCKCNGDCATGSRRYRASTVIGLAKVSHIRPSNSDTAECQCIISAVGQSYGLWGTSSANFLFEKIEVIGQ